MTIRQFLREVLWQLGNPWAPSPERAEQIVQDHIAKNRATAATPPPVPHGRHEAELMEEVIDQRDYARDMADQLAAAIDPTGRPGQHSGCNDPWVNALDLLDRTDRACQSLPAHPAGHAPREALSPDSCGPGCPGHEQVLVCDTCATDWPCRPTRAYQAGVAAALDLTPHRRPSWM